MKLKGVGRVRARRLYDSGIKSPAEIVKHKDKVSILLGKKIAENIVKQIKGTS